MTPDVRLMQGDCLEMMTDIAPGSIDMILTDLPYGTTACPWDSVIPFAPLWQHYKRCIKKGGVVCLFGSQPFTSALVMSNAAWFKHELIWNKGRGSEPQLANVRPQKAHENIIIFGEGRVTYNPQKEPRDRSVFRGALPANRSNNRRDGKGQNIMTGSPSLDRTYTDRFPISVVFASNSNQTNKQHPTEKPVSLLEWLIRTYSNEGETILDSCMGSGSTGVACLRTERNFMGIEKDAHYFKVAKARLEQPYTLPLIT